MRNAIIKCITFTEQQINEKIKEEILKGKEKQNEKKKD